MGSVVKGHPTHKSEMNYRNRGEGSYTYSWAAVDCYTHWRPDWGWWFMWWWSGSPPDGDVTDETLPPAPPPPAVVVSIIIPFAPLSARNGASGLIFSSG